MNKLSLILAAGIIPLGAYARTGTQSKMVYPVTIDISGYSLKDTGKYKMVHKECYLMKGGKMMHKKDGKLTTMDKDVILHDGSTVMLDGTVVRKDGTKIMLKEGEKIEMDGTIKPAKM